jgi:hypothetical protein
LDDLDQVAQRCGRSVSSDPFFEHDEIIVNAARRRGFTAQRATSS